MAGVKGRSGGPRANSGGARPGAGRKPKPPPVVTVDATQDALTFLLGVMNDAGAPLQQRVRAAVAAAQYQRVKAGDGGKRDAVNEAAKKAAGGGKFTPAAAPKLIVNNR